MMDYSIYEQAERNTVMRAYIYNPSPSLSQISGVWHPFPCTAEELGATFHAIGYDDGGSGKIFIKEYESKIDGLAQFLPELVHADELNCLASQIEGLNPINAEVLEALVEKGIHTDSMASLIDLTKNIDSYAVIPGINDYEALGLFEFEILQDLNGLRIAELESTRNEDDFNLSVYINSLEQHFNAKSFGETRHNEIGGHFTKHGYLNETTAPFVKSHTNKKDVPQEYQISADAAQAPVAGKSTEKIKIESTDLTALAYKMHILSGDYLTAIHRNVSVLSEPGGTHYLMLVNSFGMYLADTRLFYQKNTDLYSVWVDCSRSTVGLAAYMLTVTNREDGRAYGSFTEVDFWGIGEDIKANMIEHTGITATTKSGEEKTFTFQQWNDVELIDRLKFKTWNSHFSPKDIEIINAHIKNVAQKCGDMAKPITPEVFFAGQNNEYMRQADTPAYNMLRIPHEVARQFLLDCPSGEVYRLEPVKPARVYRHDTVSHGLNYEAYREFAIKHGDRAKLNSWCEKEVTDILGRLGRAEPQKHYDMEL